MKRPIGIHHIQSIVKIRAQPVAEGWRETSAPEKPSPPTTRIIDSAMATPEPATGKSRLLGVNFGGPGQGLRSLGRAVTELNLQTTVFERPKQGLILVATKTGRVAKKVFGSESEPAYALLSERQVLDWESPHFEWVPEILTWDIPGLHLDMAALSPRSANIQVKPKSTEGKIAREDFKDEKFASKPPSTVIQPPRNGETLALKYAVGSFLGKGGFAICYTGEVRPPGKKAKFYALKIVKAHMNQPKMEDKFRTELQIHAKMHHQNIVKFKRAFTYLESTYVVLELCANGSIMEMVKVRKGLSMPEVRRFTIQLCGAIKYMHARNVIHRDLKMGNLFLDENMDLKLGDFGLAAVLVSPKEYNCAVRGNNFLRRTTLCGTPNYIAPEILKKGQKGHDHKVDLWAIGVIMFAMITAYPPFQSRSPDEIYRKAKEVEYEWPDDANCRSVVPQEVKDLVARLLVVDAEARLDPDQIVGHPFFAMHGGKCIPKVMHPQAKCTTPDYLDPAGPRGDIILAAHPTCCLSDFARECGVGHLAGLPEPFEVVGGDVDVSLYRACQDEELKGTYPIVPLPKNMLYESIRPSKNKGELQILLASKDSFSDTDSVKNRSRRAKPSNQPPSQRAIDDLSIGRPGPSQSHAARLRNSRIRSGATHLVNRAGSTASKLSRVSTSSRVTRSANFEPVPLSSEPISNPTTLTSDQPLDQSYPNPDEARRERAAPTKARIASAVQSEMTDPNGSDSASVKSSSSKRSKQVPISEPLRLVGAAQGALSKPPARASTTVQRSLSHRSKQVVQSDTQQETISQSQEGVTSSMQVETPEPLASKQGSVRSSYRSGNVPKSAVQQGKMPQTRGRVASAGKKDINERSDSEKGSARSTIDPPTASENGSMRSLSKASVRSSSSKWSIEVREPVFEPGEKAFVRPIHGPSTQTNLPESDKVSTRSLDSHKARQTAVSSPIIGPKDIPEFVSGTNPVEVLEKLCNSYEKLRRSLSRAETDHPPFNHEERVTRRRPLVTRWVDYTNKFGIGYILSNGTVGSIFIGGEQSRSVCIAVANAEEHFRNRKHKEYVEHDQVIQQTGAHVEFVENWDTEGFKRVSIAPDKFQIELDKDAQNFIKKFPARNANDAQKWRKIMYWEKFGIYMINQLARNEPNWDPTHIEGQRNHDGPESLGEFGVGGNFIKFYQRLGNVGIWGFGDGSFQFNFPDHTKIVISDDGTWVDFYHLPVHSAKNLKRGDKVGSMDLADRSSLSYPVHVMLAGRCGEEDFQEIVSENCFEAKLKWMKNVMGEWGCCGGLGFMSKKNERMKWGGMSEKKGNNEGQEKFVWATVGRVGGDTPWYCEGGEKSGDTAGKGA